VCQQGRPPPGRCQLVASLFDQRTGPRPSCLRCLSWSYGRMFLSMPYSTTESFLATCPRAEAGRIPRSVKRWYASRNGVGLIVGDNIITSTSTLVMPARLSGGTVSAATLLVTISPQDPRLVQGGCYRVLGVMIGVGEVLYQPTAARSRVPVVHAESWEQAPSAGAQCAANAG
jgi:hypothetical protein